ncbi:MAG: purine-binding chemotaxis protein CheW [Lachnospiraceae bacterium]|jgi:purine-binding chemotaxis protein CheW|nr:purine-binding chemotaxis protein CheW [Lachnospiraceae bacterium]
MEEVKVALDSETTQFIVVKLGDEQYGIDIKFVDNIVRMQHITRVPNVQEYLKGVINLRGEVIPVMSARLKMGLPADEYTKSTRIIILRLEQHGTIGIVVDEVKEVVTLDNRQIEKVSYDSKEEKDYFLFGIGKYEDGGLISLLDLNAVVLDKEGV